MKYFIKNYLRGIGVAISLFFFVATVVCFVLADAGVLRALAGEITWKVPLVLAAAGILLGATSYAISETL